MNTYIAILRGKRIEVQAATSFAAQTEAARVFKLKRNHWEISITLAAVGSRPVPVDPAAL